METLVFSLSVTCGGLLGWLGVLYWFKIPSIILKSNKAITHHKAQADYYHELANKANELNGNLRKVLDEYKEIEVKRSIEEFKKKSKGGPL